MSVRYGLLSLLQHGPQYGAQLRSEFESRTGSAWPLNIGQVYTTLSRLERDGLVAPAGETVSGHRLHALTDTGRMALNAWFARPVDRTLPARDELAIKLVIAAGAPHADLTGILQTQRRHTVRAQRDCARLRARAPAAPPHNPGALAGLLVVEQLILHAEAEVRWLDFCTSQLAASAATHHTTTEPESCPTTGPQRATTGLPEPRSPAQPDPPRGTDQEFHPATMAKLRAAAEPERHPAPRGVTAADSAPGPPSRLESHPPGNRPGTRPEPRS